MFITPALLPALERAGWYEYNALAPSDHRAGFLDFNLLLLFLNRITNITHPATRKLRLHCPKRVDRYLKNMRYLFDSRKLLHAATELETKAREDG